MSVAGLSRIGALALRMKLKKISLRPVKKIEFTFDPFRPDVRSCRDLMSALYTKSKRASNPECSFKFNVKSDLCEPTFKVEYDDGEKVIFKTQNLNLKEIVDILAVQTEDKISKMQVVGGPGPKLGKGGAKKKKATKK